MRLAPALLAACAAVSAASDSSAADTPPKADAGKPLRLALAQGKTYLYRLSETITARRTIDLPDVGKQTFEDERIEIAWDAGITLQRVTESGDVIVSLMPARVRGSVTDRPARTEPFDSDDPKHPVTSSLLGCGLRVTLSPTARVKEVALPRGGPTHAADGSERVPLDSDAAFAKAFAQQFLHELPDAAPSATTAWTQTRALAPEWLCDPSLVVGYTLGDAEERSVVQKLLPDSLVAVVRARGSRDVPHTDVPKNIDDEDLRQLRPGRVGELLEQWLVLGEVRLQRETGLVALRTAATTLNTHVNPIRIPKGLQPQLPGAPAQDVVSHPTDLTHEITLRVELLEVR